METSRIASVRIIKEIVKNNVRVPMNIVVINLANGKPAIVRNADQFFIDMEESGLSVGKVNSLNHPSVAKAKMYLTGGTVFGDFTYHKAGEKYIVTKDSRVITDKTHPKFGTVTVGSEQISEKDRTIVNEGFLTLMRAERFEQMFINAEIKQQADDALSGLFDLGSTASVASDEPINTEDLPEALLVGAGIEETVTATKK